jgi:NAD(P)-dependent dehydrogenase (short-subunit alcohol dehydrogenase family)
MSHWTGKAAVVTGAASGIGAALVGELLQRGASVLALDVSADGLAGLPAHARLRTLRVDVTDAATVRAAYEGVVAEHGRLDVAFNNAGVVVGGPFEDMDPEVWTRVVDINFWGVVHGTEAAYALMLRQGSGHIVNTASSAGVMPVAKSVAYAATKHAVVGLSTSLRAEARAKGIRVSVVIPGVVDTAIFDQATNVGGYDYKAAMKRVPFAKISPADAATAILAGVERNRQFITFPAYNKVLAGLTRLAPELMGKVINR